MPSTSSATLRPDNDATASNRARVQSPAAVNRAFCIAGTGYSGPLPQTERAPADLKQLVQVLARQAARRHFRRGYTILSVPLLLGALAIALLVAVLLCQLVRGS